MFTMHPWLWLLILAVIIWKINLSTAETRVVCYYTNWSVYRPGTAKFNPQNINPYLCTHLIYAFGGFTKENNFKPFDKYQDIEKGGYAKFTGLKTYNKNLKTMLAVGGWNEGSSRFSPMVANPERRKDFVKNSIKFLRQNHFDGLDLDWEYPSFRDGGKPRDRDNYATLVQELREEYDRESEKTGRPRLLLTMAVPAGIEYINKGYDVPRLMKYLDWMNILSYDYHSAFEPAVNHHSPLFSLEEDSEYNYDAELNINHTINHYLDAGAIQSKLVLGIPTYGRSYTLFNPDATEIGDPADGPGEMGDATRENGYLAYYEICEKVKSEEWIVEQPDPNAMGPYAFKDDQWVGYDDENIVRKKAEFVARRRLGGIMFWSIDNDDFRGNCHGKPYPLIEAAKEALMAAAGQPIDNTIASEKPTKTKSRSRTRPNTKKIIVSRDEDDDEDSKPAQNSGGRQNADIPASRKRTRTKSQSRDEEPQRSSKRRLRVHKKEEEVEPEEEEEEEEEEEVSKKPRLRVNKEQSPRRKESKRRGTTTTTNRPSALTPAYHTPEPPTTPDPGSDFKCEDEGFFPHPRDCKKYFWCLSSGPSELGIVAHQFTCPSGLYFNKAADSCDYTQNVLCKKKAKATVASSTTSTTTTTAASVSTSTTRRPTTKTTTATARTTSTTTSEYEDEYEYEDEDEDLEDEEVDSEEDPRVIKELIDLIRKAGGIEELEKQLKLHEDGTVSVTAPGSTTPPAFSKSLYQRVLNRAAGKNTEKPTLKPKNSRGPQYDGTKDGDGSTNKRRPQYTAIARQRSSTEKSQNEEAQVEENKEEKSSSRKITQPQYKTIARNRPSTSTEADIETTRLRSETTIDEEDEGTTKLSPEYVTIRRTRPTTQEPTPKYVEIRGRTSSVTTDEETKITERTATSNKTSELSNNEYINTVEQQNITDTIEVAKTVEGRLLPDEESKLATTKDLQNSTENALSQDRSSTISIEQPSTTASTKVSEPISSRNLLRPKPFQKTIESTDNTNITENTTKRASNRFTIQDARFKNSRKRVPFTKPEEAGTSKDLIDEDFPDTDQENISNETDSPTVPDSLRKKLKIQNSSKQAVPPVVRPRPFANRQNSGTPANSGEDRVITESTNQERTPTRRGTAKFEVPQYQSGNPDDRYHYYDDGSYDSRSLQERKYRPDIAQEIADLSSLTSADISGKRLNGGSTRRLGSRQRVTSSENPSNLNTTTVKNEETQEEKLKTSSRTPPVTRKLDFGKNNKRVVRFPTTTSSATSGSEIEEPSTSSTQSSRIQKKSPVFIRPPAFRRPLNEKSVNETTDKPKPLQRNVFENPARKRLVLNQGNATQEIVSENPLNKTSRKVIRRFRPTFRSTTSTTISTTTTTTTTTTTPLPTTESQENHIAGDDFTTTTTTTELNNDQQNITEVIDFTQNTTYENNVTLLPVAVTLLPVAVTQDNDVNSTITEKGSSDNDDDVYRTSEEEEENIKLSETSIREKSEIHINALNDNSDKHRRRVVKRIRNEGKTSQTKFNYPEEEEEGKDSKEKLNINFDPVTEHNPVHRTRKIIRKLPQTTNEPTTTQSSVSEAHKGRTRKIIRRLRPTTTPSPSTNTLEDKIVKTKLYGAKRLRPVKPSEAPESEDIEQKGNEYPRFNFRKHQNITGNSSEEQKPIIRRIPPQRRQKVKIYNGKENIDEEETGEKSLSEEEQKPIIRRVVPQRRRYGTKENSTDEENLENEEVGKRKSLVYGVQRRRYGTKENTGESNEESEENEEVGKRKSIVYGTQRRRILKPIINPSEDENIEKNDNSSESTKVEEEKSSVFIKRRQKFGLRNSTILNKETSSIRTIEEESSKQNTTETSNPTTTELETNEEAVTQIKQNTTETSNPTTTELETNEETVIQIKQNTTETFNPTTELETNEETVTQMKQNTTEGATETQTIEENSTKLEEPQDTTEIERKNPSTTESGDAEEDEQSTTEQIQEFSSTAPSVEEQTDTEKEVSVDSREKTVETSTNLHGTRLVLKVPTTTVKQNRLSVYSRFNTKEESEDQEKLDPIIELKSTTEYDTSSFESSTEIEEIPTTSIGTDEEGTTVDFTELPTTELDFTTTDLPNITTPETERTTIKTTTPFYYRQKLSRPPFLHQRARPVTEASRPVITPASRQFTRDGGFSRYTTRKNRFRSRFEKKSTTELTTKAEVIENNNEEDNSTLDLAQNVTTTESYNETSLRSTEVTGSTISTLSTLLSTATPEYETTKEISEISTGTSTEMDEVDSITTEFVTSTEVYEEKLILQEFFSARNATEGNVTEVVQTSTTINPVTTLDSGSTTEELSIEAIQEITDSILEKELLELIEKFEEDRETLHEAQKEGYLNFTKENQTELYSKAILDSLFNTTLTKNITELLQEINFNSSTETPKLEQFEELLQPENSTNQTRKPYVPPRRTFTTKSPTEEDVLSIIDKINGDSEEESSQRPLFKPSSPRSKYKPRVKPTTERALFKQTTTRRVSNERSTLNRRLFIRPTTERIILNKHNYQGVTEKPEEEYYENDEEEEEEYGDDEEGDGEEEEEEEENPVEEEEVDRNHPNSFYRQNKPQYVPKRFRGSTEKPSSLPPRRFGKIPNSPIIKQTNNPQGNIETKNSRNRLFNKSRKINTPYSGSSTTTTTLAPPTVITEETITPTEEFSNPTIFTTSSYEEETIQTSTIGETRSSTEIPELPSTVSTTIVETRSSTEVPELSSTVPTTIGETRSTTEIPEQPFTLQHIFSEPENSSTTETFAEVTTERGDKKLERLIEVNRIVEVSLKEGKLKHNAMVENQVTLIPTLDRIGAINRVTVIKIVDPINGTNSSAIVFNVTDGSGRVELSANITIPVELNGTIIEHENLINDSINAIYSNLKLNNNNNSSNGTDLIKNGTKLEENNLINELFNHVNGSNDQLYGAGELTDYGHKLEAYMPPHTKEEEDYAKAHIRIDGKSVVNTFTPKPSAFNSESSTISLEGLFQPHTRQEDPNDEILQTQNANYVNIKILEQDGSPRRLKYNENQPLIPIRLLKQDEYTTSRAQVVEITPEMNAGVIKIAPIAISLGNMQRVSSHRHSDYTEHTTVVFPISTNKGDE